jgi:hypothetical protein
MPEGRLCGLSGDGVKTGRNEGRTMTWDREDEAEEDEKGDRMNARWTRDGRGA